MQQDISARGKTKLVSLDRFSPGNIADASISVHKRGVGDMDIIGYLYITGILGKIKVGRGNAMRRTDETNGQISARSGVGDIRVPASYW